MAHHGFGSRLAEQVPNSEQLLTGECHGLLEGNELCARIDPRAIMGVRRFGRVVKQKTSGLTFAASAATSVLRSGSPSFAAGRIQSCRINIADAHHLEFRVGVERHRVMHSAFTHPDDKDFVFAHEMKN
jgi:hypothetical protein